MYDNPIRVVHVIGKMIGGGVEQVAMNYYSHVDHARVQFDFIITDDSTVVDENKKIIEALGGRLFVVPAYRRLRTFEDSLYALFAEHPEWRIVHSHMNSLSVFVLKQAKRAGIPVRIAHSHSTSGKGEYAKNAVKALLKTQANRYPTERFACSRYAGEWLFGKGRGFEVVYNAIDLRRFSFNAEARAKARADLGLVGGQFAVGHVGRFMAQKNHVFLIDAFEQVARRREDAVLLLVGTGEAEACVESSVVERGLSGRVRFLGQRTDMPDMYAAFDAFVLPSLYEGLGLVGVEAQRSGLPCLLSDAITREVDVTGECRFLPIDDPTVWADSICGLGARSDGERSAVDDAAFDDYDIERRGAWLTEKYLDLYGRHCG